MARLLKRAAAKSPPTGTAGAGATRADAKGSGAKGAGAKSSGSTSSGASSSGGRRWGRTARSGARAMDGAAPKVRRIAQLRQAYTVTKAADPKLPLVLAGVFLGIFALLLALGFAVGHPVYVGLLGFLIALVAATFVFGRRAERSAYRQIEGQPGAAAAVLNSLRGGWTVTPAVAVTRQQDILHRAVGRPGIVLVAEGSPQRLPALLTAERRKLARLLPDVPVSEVLVGDGEGQVPLRKVNAKVTRLKRSLTREQVAETNRRLKAMGTMNVPVPKGPLPRGGRAPRGPRG